MAFHLLIRSEPPCPYCEKAKRLLTEAGYEFTVTDHETPEKVQAFKEAGYRTFPQVFEHGQLIGGADALEEYLSSAF